MSWQEYVDKNLVVPGKVLKGAIYSLGGDNMGQSKDFKITDSEAAALIKGFSDANAVRSVSPKVEGKKFIVVKVDERSLYAKEGTNGLCCVKTNSVVLIGYYDKTIQAGDANKSVEALADYLIDQGS